MASRKVEHWQTERLVPVCPTWSSCLFEAVLDGVMIVSLINMEALWTFWAFTQPYLKWVALDLSDGKFCKYSYV